MFDSEIKIVLKVKKIGEDIKLNNKESTNITQSIKV